MPAPCQLLDVVRFSFSSSRPVRLGLAVGALGGPLRRPRSSARASADRSVVHQDPGRLKEGTKVPCFSPSRQQPRGFAFGLFQPLRKVLSHSFQPWFLHADDTSVPQFVPSTNSTSHISISATRQVIPRCSNRLANIATVSSSSGSRMATTLPERPHSIRHLRLTR